jgi:acetolactate synthase-1/2/3 large subunit
VNGANALIRTLVDAGVDVCFMNPGTSEMHFVAALDDVPEMRGVLALFEGVATGAADGYARIAGKPAATLLHLGPGLGNGLANLHNARKAFTPIVNIVGDHATYHKQFDAQLESDIETVARNVSTWIRSSESTKAIASDTADAVAAAIGPPGQVATLILPADVSWSDGGDPAPAVAPPPPASVDASLVAELAAILQSDEPACLFIGGRACRADVLVDASRIANTTGAKLMAETFPARLERGAGRVPIDRLAYLAEFAAMQLDGLRHLILVDAKSPVSFFAYPDKASDLVPEGCTVHVLAGRDGDPAAALAALAGAVAAPADAATLQAPARPDLPTGALTADAVCQIVGALLPEGAIVSDEGNTAGLFAAGHTAGAPPHDWLCLTGGAIGQGLPVALGAAVAAPDRRVIALQADGSAMYTLQSWWTMAREQLDVVTVLFNNSSYAVLNMELQRVGATAGGEKAKAMLDLHGPDLDFVALATGMGVPATRSTTCDEFAEQLRAALATDGPTVIEAIVPSIL